jgi:hypothetical protein
MPRLTPRKGMPSPRLSEGEFRKRFLAQFQDPAFDALARELDKIAAVAWDAYEHSRKAPQTRKAGNEFADPDYDLSVDWLAARAAIADAQRRHADRSRPAILLINCSSRSPRETPDSETHPISARIASPSRPGSRRPKALPLVRTAGATFAVALGAACDRRPRPDG